MKSLAVVSLLLAGQVLALPAHPKISKRGDVSINSLLSMVAQLFPVKIAIQDIDSLISTGELALATALDIETTQNGADGCAGITIVFARGTTETGNVGALVGPPFFDAVQARLGGDTSLAVQGVDYPADIPGFLAGGSAAGSQTM